MPELKFKQIACSEATNSLGDMLFSLYGVTEGGEVYEYSYGNAEQKIKKGWAKLDMTNLSN